MRYGYFDDARREYVITNPRLPVKWINYIGTLGFGGFVDHTGGGVICKGDPTLNRLTFYVIQLPAASFNGETLYLRFKRGQETKSFSPFFVPTLDPYERFECHIGLGYTRFITEFYHIRSDITVFVPLAKPAPGGQLCVIRDMRFTNLGSDPLELDAIPVVEYSHPDALKQLTNADWVPQTMQSQAVIQAGAAPSWCSIPSCCAIPASTTLLPTCQLPHTIPSGALSWGKMNTAPGPTRLAWKPWSSAIRRRGVAII